MIIQYTATYSDVDPARIGFVQTLDTDIGNHKLALSSFPPLSPNDKYVVAEVGDRTDPEITLLGDGYYTGVFSFGFISDDMFDYVNEFHQSTRRRQRFTVNPNDVRGHQGTYRVYRTDSGAPIDHKNPCRGFMASVPFRVVEIL